MIIKEEIQYNDTTIKCELISHFDIDKVSKFKLVNLNTIKREGPLAKEVAIYKNAIQWQTYLGEVFIYFRDIEKIKVKKAGFLTNKFCFSINFSRKGGYTPKALVCVGLYKFAKSNKLGKKIYKCLNEAYKNYCEVVRDEEDLLVIQRMQEMKKSVENFNQDHKFYRMFKKRTNANFDDFMASLKSFGFSADEEPINFGPNSSQIRYRTKTMYLNESYNYFILGDSKLFNIYKQSKKEINDMFLSELDNACKNFNKIMENVYSLDLIKYVETLYTKYSTKGVGPSALDTIVTANVLGTTAAYLEATKDRSKVIDAPFYHILFEENYTGPEVYFNFSNPKIKITSEERKNIKDFIYSYTESQYISRQRRK